MTKKLLWRGMLVGILAATLATLFARSVAEPQIDIAIAVEKAGSAAHHSADHHSADHVMSAPAAADEEELVSRDTQKGLGLLTALSLYGAAIGGIFSLVFAYGYGRLGQIGPRSFSLLLAGLAYFLIVVVPSIKYPQTPPAVGQHETVAMRTAAYFAMIALSIGAAVISGKIRTGLSRSMRGFDALLLAAGVYIVLVVAGQFLLPVVDEVPGDFPATLLWNFRIASLGTQLVLWSTIGIAFGWLAERVLQRQR